jgi:hypothetical protein
MEKQMADTAADVLVQRLIEWGVDAATPSASSTFATRRPPR